MNNFTYWAPTRYNFGRGAENNVGREASNEGMTRVLLVYGGGSAVRSGLLARVKESLADSGITVFEQGGIQPNPTDDRVYEGIEMVRRNDIDGVIAVGGGDRKSVV